MGYLSESPLWRQRRRRRQRLTMTVIVLLVLAIGVGAYGYEQGWIAQPADDDAVAVLPTCPPATPHPLTPAEVRVNVYNSTSRNGLASTVADALGERSFVVETVANDPLHADVPGTAVVRYGRSGAEAASWSTRRCRRPRCASTSQGRDRRPDTSATRPAPAPAAATSTATAGPTPTPTPTCTPPAHRRPRPTSTPPTTR